MLENIASLLEENEQQKEEEQAISAGVSAGNADTGITLEAVHETEPVTTQDLPQPEKKFLLYFNAACICLICIIIIPAFLIVNTTDSDLHIEIPLRDDIRQNFRMPPIPKAFHQAEFVSFVKDSVQGRLVHDRVKGPAFVVSGFISTTPSISPDEIKLTGRVFDQEDLLLAKASASPGEQTFIITGKETRKKINSRQKVFPFQIAFANPPSKISRFSIDIE